MESILFPRNSLLHEMMISMMISMTTSFQFPLPIQPACWMLSMIFHLDCYIHSSQSTKHKAWLALHFSSTYKLYNTFITNQNSFTSYHVSIEWTRNIFIKRQLEVGCFLLRLDRTWFHLYFVECSNICQTPPWPWTIQKAMFNVRLFVYEFHSFRPLLFIWQTLYYAQIMNIRHMCIGAQATITFKVTQMKPITFG